MKNKIHLLVFLFLISCSSIDSTSEKKIDNCIQLADEIERILMENKENLIFS